MPASSKVIFAWIAGLLYCLFGILQILSAGVTDLARILAPFLIPTDIASGFVLCVIGAVFVAGAREMHARTTGGEAFLHVGMLLSVTFGLITLLDLGAQAINMILFGAGGSPWSATQMIVPMLYLTSLSLAGFAVWGRGFVHDLMPA
jgi:hypothetical protein